jgi:hypothetical protein
MQCGMKHVKGAFARCRETRLFASVFIHRKRYFFIVFCCLCLHLVLVAVFNNLPSSRDRQPPPQQQQHQQQPDDSASSLESVNDDSPLNSVLNQCVGNKSSLDQKNVCSRDEESFPTNLDFTQPAPCAWFKCLFRSKKQQQEEGSNHNNINNNNNEYGYLVAQERTSLERNKFESLEQAYHYAKYLEATYRIKQFLREPPFRFHCTKPLATALNRHSYQQQFSKIAAQKVEKKSFTPNQMIYVQKVQIAPTPSLLIGCHHTKFSHAWDELMEFLTHVVHHHQQKQQLHPTTRWLQQEQQPSSSQQQQQVERDFAETLALEVNDTIHLLVQEPRLVLDFQVLLDIHGNLYHLDLDRCFEVEKKKTEHGQISTLQEFSRV